MYSSEFDRQVHEELKRMRRVIERSMSDYYRFGNTMGRDIGDIVYQEVLGEEASQEEVEETVKYIEEMRVKVVKNRKIISENEKEFKWEAL